MTMNGKKVVIVEDPHGWYGISLVGRMGVAVINNEASDDKAEFYHLVQTDVPAHLLFHECRLKVRE